MDSFAELIAAAPTTTSRVVVPSNTGSASVHGPEPLPAAAHVSVPVPLVVSCCPLVPSSSGHVYTTFAASKFGTRNSM